MTESVISGDAAVRALPADAAVLAGALDGCPDGVAICDMQVADTPAVYVNRALEQLTGYAAAEILGRNMRFLHGGDREQDGLLRFRVAIKAGLPAQATLRNFRKDGTLFWNEVRLVPLRDARGTVTHYASFHRDAGDRLRGEPRGEVRTDARDPALTTQTMLAYLRDDKLTGLLRRGYFDELMRRDLRAAQRESRAVTLFLFEVDCFDTYRALFGQTGADQSLRRIGRTVGGCFRRASDLCARFDESRFAALCAGMTLEQALGHGETVLTRIRDLAIHHPRSTVSRFVTASAGVVAQVPDRDSDPAKLVERAEEVLARARSEGRNRIVG